MDSIHIIEKRLYSKGVIISSLFFNLLTILLEERNEYNKEGFHEIFYRFNFLGSKRIPILFHSFLIIVFSNKRNIHSFSEILILFVFLKKTNKM